MILHPAILALSIESVLVVVILSYAALLGVKIIRRWNIDSSSEQQLSLERKTYLISTVVNLALAFEVLSVVLFVYTADAIHDVFVGAMCATGSLNANPIGWSALYVKLLVLFVSGVWIAVNTIDQRAEDYPFVKLKYGLLLAVLPLVIAGASLQAVYFLGLKADIITSCCGALFSGEGKGLAGTLSALPVRPAMAAFFGSIAVFVLNGLLALQYQKAFLKYCFSLLAVVTFFVSLAAIISFISVYYYEAPTHHCPFDILQKDHRYVGYPLYMTLFGGTFSGVMVGLSERLGKKGSATGIVGPLQIKWIRASIVLMGIFTLLSLWPMVFSSFTMELQWR